ncbi:hypothetical protein [Fibrobacter sp. UWS1]|uniref:hypothetical protein n=1 Tax=Fibrobacter sp. UWS1 TaxID=1896220 RepID=UPI000BB1267C|nr:hypothetical protein [Fibrobacter sp. UWS1]PBC69260.1 hypothetical protein BGX14_1665 [Fibrobacter sp. UWS1]
MEIYYYIKNQVALQNTKCWQTYSSLRKKRTGLPVNIYVDDSGTWKKMRHANRIKIQCNKGDHPNAHGMIPMSIDDNPRILVDNPKMELSAADINAVKKFVIANKDLLIRLGSDDNFDIVDFTGAMVLP